MKFKRIKTHYVVLAVAILIYLVIYMLGKTFHPTFSTRFRVKEDILSMIEEENENRVVHLVKTNNKLIRIDYERVNSFLYQYSTGHSVSFLKDIMIDYFSAGSDADCFIYGFCGRTDMKKIVFTFPGATELEVTPNEEGIFLVLSNYEPLDAEQILGYTDDGEVYDVLEYIINYYQELQKVKMP